MDIREFLARLKTVHGPNSSGEYMCKCPAHDDRTASLSVREGDGSKILLHCMAGCEPGAVLQAMGLKLADLFPEGSRKQPRQPATKQAAPKQPAPAAQAPRKAPPLGELTKIYPYTDEAGKTLFEVCRFERTEEGQRVKTFRQRRLDPGNPKAKRDGYVWSIDGVRSVVYRLPEVLKAIQEERTVYVVEGEKDADTMASLGFTATTNPGGASKQGASKWLPEHTQQLTGARVVILPDNDAAGLNDRQQVAQKLAAVCESVKLLDLKKACATLPTKGDITDMLQIMGTTEALKALQALEAATEPVDTSEAEATAARDAAAAIINDLPGYCVHEGCISSWSEETPKRLCTFTAIASGIIMRDDGVTEEKCYAIDGWARDGHPLPRVRVPAKAYKRMEWLKEAWDLRANILPGTAVAEKVRYVIEEAGYGIAQRTTEYTHTGWRKIGGEWAYLYRGGAIGAEGITVDLGTALDDYCMDANYEPGEDEATAMLETALVLQSFADRRITTPLLAFMFLAPLRDALLRAGFPPAFSVYLVGGTGTRKSTVSALMLSFFGSFTSLNLPASFNDTANYVRKKAFDLKDMVIAVDDYHPEGNLQARKKMEDMAQQLSRAFGDLAQRGRMNADRTVQGSMPPRALAMISGEDMPNIRDSGEARYYVINIGKGDIPADETMTWLQDKAADGTLAHMMRRYVEWLAPQMDKLPAQLGARFKELRAKAQGLQVGHSRAPGTIAHLLIGYEMYTRFLIETGVLEGADGDYFKAEMSRAIEDIISNAKTQGEESREERPSRMYLRTIGELLLTKEASVVDLTDPSGSHNVNKGHVGYMDAQYYYFLPEASYVAVCAVYTKKGEAFPLTQRMLHKQLAEDGLITPDATGGKRTRNKSIGGKPVRLLWVPRANLDGPRVVNEQLRIDPDRPMEGQSFIPVNEPTPFD